MPPTGRFRHGDRSDVSGGLGFIEQTTSRTKPENGKRPRVPLRSGAVDVVGRAPALLCVRDTPTSARLT
jgi:hypothetical protein